MVDFGRLPEFPDDWEFAPPPLSPLRLDAEFWRAGIEESSIRLQWWNPDFARSDPNVVARIFRQVEPLVTHAMPSGFQALVLPGADEVSPFGWILVGTRETNANSGNFYDDDIPAIAESLPKAARRSLGSVYSYKIEISGGERLARSPVLSTRLRGINMPSIESIAGISDSEIEVKWQDNSKLASGFRVSCRDQQSGVVVQNVMINGTTQQDLVIRDLSPDTEYHVEVLAWDYYGQSWPDYKQTRTKPARDAEPKDKTYTLHLDRQIVYEGFIPYVGRFPTLGSLPSGTLRKVSLHSAWPAILFVKPGKSTADCADPNALVVLNPGTSLTAAEMTELFGSATPDLPVVFVACVTQSTPLLDWVPIVLTYRTD